jgi:uncharacterized protein HemY
VEDSVARQKERDKAAKKLAREAQEAKEEAEKRIVAEIEAAKAQHGVDVKKDRPNLLETFSSRAVDGVWNLSAPKDLTVHLDLDISDDLEGDLEALARLSRLGDGKGARQFFAKNLHEHIDNPYVLVCYAEVLMQQGDYKAMTDLNPEPIYNPESRINDSEEGRLLQMYWELMQLLANSHRPGLQREHFSVLPEALQALGELVSQDGREISSTEVSDLLYAGPRTC